MQIRSDTQLGSTLWEMLVVLFIISVAGAFSLLASRGLLSGHALGMQAREAMAILSTVDARALSTGSEIQVEMDLVAQAMWERYSGASNSDDRPCLFRFSSGVRISRASFGVGGQRSVRSVFYGNGVSSPGSLTLTDQTGATCTIIQSIRGRRHLECDS